MKTILAAVSLAIICAAALADEQMPIEKPSKRMIEICEKYNLVPAYAFHKESDAKKTEYWVFIGKAPSYRYHVLPILVPKNASDSTVELAIMESETCAMFYDHLLEKEKAEQDKWKQQGI